MTVTTVWPMPQRHDERPDGFAVPPEVGLVRAPDTGEPALRTVREALRRAGAARIRESGADPGTDVTVWLSGGPAVLRRVGVADRAGLPEEGYVLAAGQDAGRGHIVLDGTDGAGAFYAALTFAQVVQDGWMPGLAVRDWPSMRYRGSIEGFYGTPWSHADRLDHVAYLGAHKMNTYQYAPKDDPYHRERWREPYPPDRLAHLGELIARARSWHVGFTFALSPGLSVRYTAPADIDALLAKFEALYALGARSFNVPFDDIDYGVWHSPADRDRFGEGGAGAGAAQAHVLNAVQAWVRGKGDVHPLQTVPTEYHDLADSPYKRALRDHLDPEVIVHWTGTDVIPETITAAEAARAREVFGHPIMVWDNYPVNDYLPGRLPLAALTGRGPGLSAEVTGVISNPANQAAVSKVALFSFAGLGWNEESHDARHAWSSALAERAGGDAATTAALRAFADVSTYDGRLHHTQAPELAAAVGAFWRRWSGGDRTGAIEGLRPAVRALVAAPAAIRAGVTDPAFAEEAGAWLEATGLWAAALDAALDLLADQAGRAPVHRERIHALTARANAIRDTRAPHDTTAPRIGDGVIDTFLGAATATVERSPALDGPRLDAVDGRPPVGAEEPAPPSAVTEVTSVRTEPRPT
jgi:hyaluronoglucosaminidase